MFKTSKIVLIVVLVALLLTLGVAADATGYDVLLTAPVDGLLALGTTFTAQVLDVSSGQMTSRSAVVEGYIRWNYPPARPVEYLVYLRDGCTGSACPWFIWSRATIDQYGGV